MSKIFMKKFFVKPYFRDWIPILEKNTRKDA